MKNASGFLGIVMLDTRFARPVGDVGHPDTFWVPVRREVIKGVWPADVVRSAESLRAAGLAPHFAAMMRRLELAGGRAITTSCGFLVLMQAELQAAVEVPVVTSSLLLLPALLEQHAAVGVLTISAEQLEHEHLRCAGIQSNRLADVVVQGVAADSTFATCILGNRSQMALDEAERDVVAAAVALKARAPQLSMVVLECTNMPPYRKQIERVTGLKTYCLNDCGVLFAPWSGVTQTQSARG